MENKFGKDKKLIFLWVKVNGFGNNFYFYLILFDFYCCDIMCKYYCYINY